MKIVRQIAFLLAAHTAASCTTMESIQKGSPSYVVDYDGVDRMALVDCVVAGMKRKKAYYHRIVPGPDFLTVESSVSAFIPGGAVLLESEGAVPYFASRFYADRVEIYGRFSIWGDHGKDVIPFVEECVATLGGTSAQRALN